MRSLLTILIILSLFHCSKNDASAFEIQTRRLFFDADLLKSGEAIFRFYRASDFLVLDPPPEGYTVYPPLSAIGSDGRIDNHVFRFTKHPYLNIPLRGGELIISSREKDNKRVYSEPALKFFFDTEQQMEYAYEQLSELYSKLSTRKRFSSSGDRKNAEFTDDNAKSIKEVGFLQGGWDDLENGYVIVFGLGNDLDIDKD